MTAIEKLIEVLTYKKQFCNQATKEGMAMFDAYNTSISEAESFLPIEKQQIVDAYINGMHKGNELHKGVEKITLDVNSLNYSLDLSEQYYQNTFKK